MTTTENNVAAQAGDEPMREEREIQLSIWRKEVARLNEVIDFVSREPANQWEKSLRKFALDLHSDIGMVSPRATADVERDAARWRYWREKYGAECRMIPGAIFYADTPDKLDTAMDLCMPDIATTKPGA